MLLIFTIIFIGGLIFLTRVYESMGKFIQVYIICILELMCQSNALQQFDIFHRIFSDYWNIFRNGIKTI